MNLADIPKHRDSQILKLKRDCRKLLRVKINYSDWHKRLVRIYGQIPGFFSSGYALSPLVVQIEVTHRCNLNCSTCFQKKGSRIEKELTLPDGFNYLNLFC